MRWPDRQRAGGCAANLVAAPTTAAALAAVDRNVRPPALSSGLPAIDGVFHEVCAGNGTLSHCVAHHGLAAGTLSETDGPKAAALPLAFPAPARVVGDAMTHDWSRDPALAVGGGTPCQPVAPSGHGLALDDPRAVVTVHALARAAALSGALSADMENHADVLTVADGAVRDEIVAVFAAHGFALVDVTFLCPTSVGGVPRRKRVALRFERMRMVERLSPCPPLRPMRSPALAIADIMLPLAQLPASAFLPGTVTLRSTPTALDDGVVIAADLKIVGARTPLFVGSHVMLRGETAQYVVEDFGDDGSLYLFHDVRRKEHHRGPIERGAVFVHLDQQHHLLDTRGKASAFTKMSVPPLCAGKQLWLRDGRAVVPQPIELFRLLELADSVHDSFITANPNAPQSATYGNAGDGMAVRLAEPMAARLTTRLRALAARDAFDGAADDGSFERRAAAHFDIVDDGATYVAFVTADAAGTLRLLVASDLVSLPRLPVDAAGGKARRSAVAACDALAGQLLPGERSCPILVHDGDFRLVALPMLHHTATRRATPYSHWASLDDLAHTPLWRAAIFTFAHLATFMRADHGRFDKTLGRMVGTRGARSLRPLATRPYTPTPEPAHWPQQLHVLECVDTALRAALQARPRSDPFRDYLLEWVDQVDTSPNALTPHVLRGARHDYANPKLVTTPFPDAAPSAKTDPIQFPRAQSTTHKPRKLTDILYPWAIKKLARWLREIVADLQAWLRKPTRPRRRAKPRVIGQDGFLPEARNIVWDLENMLVDELGPYFAPVDFTAATGTSLNTAFLDTALEHCDDQALRSMLVNGFVFGFDAELQIVVLPHLLSLALGVERGTKELRRLIGEGYFRAVDATSAHLARLDDEDVVLALGQLPCRMQAQGMVERRLEDRPRRTEDAGQPRKPLRDGLGVLVRPLNAITDPAGLVNGRRRLPREWKPTVRLVMVANSILQSAALVWRQPVVAFSDDFKDFFNQLYLHPSQRWLSTLIWLQLGANGPAYSHVMELSLGFGCNVSSNYAQRFAHELVRLFCQRFDAEEAAILDAETDPSRRAWLDARRKLGEITGNNEARLYSLMCYTDDPHGMCVGVDRLVRMLRCWRGLTLAINARMAIAAKRQAGTSALWLGIRSLTTLGVVTVPPAKRTRATNVLRNIVNGDGVQMGELKSLAGLLEHLRPFADDVAGIMYGFHPRDSARLGPTDPAPPSEPRREQAARWIVVLATRPGVSCLVAVRLAAPINAAAVYEMSSDAAKDGTTTPGIAGYMHGYAWCVPLLPADVVGPLQIPIPVLELAAIVGNFYVLAERIPDAVDVVILSDSITSVDALVNESARAPLMQFLHLALTRHPQFARIGPRTFAEHGFGETNVFSDALTRGYIDTLKACCRQLSVTLETVSVPREFLDLLDELRARNAALCAARGSTDDTRSIRQGPGVLTGTASNPGPTTNAPTRHSEPTAAPAQRPPPVPTLGAVVFHGASPPPPPTRPASAPSLRALADEFIFGRPPTPRLSAGASPRTAPPLASQARPERACDTPPTRPATPLSPPVFDVTPAAALPAPRSTATIAPPTLSFGRAPSPTTHRPRHGSPPPPPMRAPTPTVVRPVSVRSTPVDHGTAVRPSARLAPRQGTRAGPSATGASASSPRRAASARPASPPPSRLLSASPNSPFRAPESPFRASVATRPPSATAPSLRSSELHDSLRADTSRLRLRVGDDSLLRALIDDCAHLVDDSRPATTRKKDESHWRKWCAFCAMLGTSPWRDDPAANSGVDAAGHRRECFLQAAFLVHAYKTMKPRSRSDPAPKPASAAACVSSVRRVHALSGITLPRAPAINRITAGLCRRYVQAHGTAALMPSRKEPLKKEHLVAIYRVADGTPLRRSRKVHWASVFFTAWRAFVNTTRTTGSRKDDLLEMTVKSFTRGSISRANLRWRIGGVVYANITRELLARLAPGDAAILIPGCSKNDPFALFFGSSPMYLPYAPDDSTNAAAALRDLELVAPVSGPRRSLVPLFVSDESLAPLTHAQADDAFDALTALALDPAVARTLSLHSGRVFLASALKALGYDDPDIQAFVRWRDPASIAIYAHREPDEYIAALSRALNVDITSVLTKNLPTCDNDADVAALQHTRFPDESADDTTPTDDERTAHAERQAALAAAPPTAAPRPAAPPLAGLHLPGFSAAPSSPPRPSTPQPDPSLLATPGSTYERSDVTPGSAVAVRFDAPRPAYFRGTVRSCRERNARVLFADGETLDVDYELLRRVV